MRLAAIATGLMSMGLYVQAHAQTFNERYDLFNEGEGEFGLGVEVLPSGRVIALCNSGYSLDGLFYSSGVSSILLDTHFQPLGQFRLHIPERANYIGWSNASGPTNNGGSIIGGSTYAEGDTNRATLYWMDPDGIVTNYRELDLPGRSWIGRQAKQTPDGGYVLCGETSTVGFLDAFLLKTDSEGELEWVRTYGDQFTDYATAVDMDSSTGGFFLGGQKRVTSSNKQLWVQCLNDTGAVVWSKVWGTAYDEPLAHISTLADGNILVSSGWGTSVNNYAKYMAKLHRSDGAIMWERTYGGPCEGCPLFVGIELLPGGDLIAVGHTLVPGSSYWGTLLRTTSEGDSLWMRNYQYHDAVVNNGRGLLRDVQPTPDGGFIAVGVALSVPGHYTQDVWVVKTDSMGCIEPGCHIITGVETQITNLKDVLRVWPNPVAQDASVHVSIDLPANFEPQGALRLSVVSNDGRLVQQQRVASLTSPTSLALPPSCSAGIYHLHLSDDTRWISGAKLVVR